MPQVGELYVHYKKHDRYRVVGVALDSNSDKQMVVYEPLYENPAAKLFVRPLKEWNEVVEWKGERLVRFKKAE